MEYQSYEQCLNYNLSNDEVIFNGTDVPRMNAGNQALVDLRPPSSESEYELSDDDNDGDDDDDDDGEEIEEINCYDSGKGDIQDESLAILETAVNGAGNGEDTAYKNGYIEEKDTESPPVDGVKKKRKRKTKDGSTNGKKKKRISKPSYQRKNIRNIIKETQLDSETLVAQNEEMERKKRLLELQMRIHGEFQGPSTSYLEGKSQLKSLLQCVEEEETVEDEIKKENDIPKEKDIIEVGSSDDDECVVIDNTEEEPENDADDDPENSGCHVNDAFNCPDDHGRVLVNVGHPEDEPDIFLAPQLATFIKPHQIGGIRFLYDNVIENVSRFKHSNGFGCILAHSMGLGKTIQVISFIDIFLRHTEARTVLCIVPINTLQNWISEFNMWLPSPDKVQDAHVRPRGFAVHIINDTHKTITARANVIETWYRNGGVLLMGYEMYRLLSSRKTIIRKPKKNSKKANEPMVIDLEQEDKDKELQLDMQSALTRPGPDMIICDEGHRIKNSLAGISQSLKNIKTRRRIVLTGYPLQNNLMEYWCMVDFIRPNFLGSKTEFANMFERPIMNGQCVDSTLKDARVMRFRAHVLHSLLEGFVQRRSHAVLQISLPPKQEHVILVRMSPIQRRLYSEFMMMLEENKLNSFVSTNPLKAFSVCCKIWNHPDILQKIIEKHSADDDLDLYDSEKSNGKKGKGKGTPLPSMQNPYPPFAQNGGCSPFIDNRSQTITYEWAEPILKEYSPGLLENGGKMVLLYSIVEEAMKIGDKVLIFSQSLFTLSLIEEFLSKQSVPLPDVNENWAKNKTYFRLDGSTSATERERLINAFNDYDNLKCNVFLLSTRAGCLGINLVGANRVIVMDASWNPCHDCQAICRVYRYGQIKPCYVYRFVTDNTMEKKIYDRQVNKQGMSARVVDELQPQNNFTRKQVDSLLCYQDTDMPGVESVDWSDKYDDTVLVNVLSKHGQWITKEPFSHESLLIHRSDDRLTKAEKRLAKQSYESEKRLNVGYSRPSYPAYYPRTGGGIPPQSGMPPRDHYMPSYHHHHGHPPHTSYGLPRHMTPAHQPRVASQGSIIKSLQRPGVSVTQIITTTAIVIPSTSTMPDSERPRIPPGKKILVIKTPKGVYIRTEEGKIFAVRSSKSSTIDGQTSESQVTTSAVNTVTMSQNSNSPAAQSSTTTINNKGPLAMLNEMLQTHPSDSLQRSSPLPYVNRPLQSLECMLANSSLPQPSPYTGISSLPYYSMPPDYSAMDMQQRHTSSNRNILHEAFCLDEPSLVSSEDTEQSNSSASNVSVTSNPCSTNAPPQKQLDVVGDELAYSLNCALPTNVPNFNELMPGLENTGSRDETRNSPQPFTTSVNNQNTQHFSAQSTNQKHSESDFPGKELNMNATQGVNGTQVPNYDFGGHLGTFGSQFGQSAFLPCVTEGLSGASPYYTNHMMDSAQNTKATVSQINPPYSTSFLRR